MRAACLKDAKKSYTMESAMFKMHASETPARDYKDLGLHVPVEHYSHLYQRATRYREAKASVEAVQLHLSRLLLLGRYMDIIEQPRSILRQAGQTSPVKILIPEQIFVPEVKKGQIMEELNAMEDFKRDISFHVQKGDDGQIVLTANLKDRFHDIRMEVLVDFKSLGINAARVNFVRHPSEDCPNVAWRMERLVGFVIGKGLNRKLQETFGGGEGCGNLRLMLQGLLPLAMNVKASAGFSDEQEMLAGIRERLTGSCAGYVKRPQ